MLVALTTAVLVCWLPSCAIPDDAICFSSLPSALRSFLMDDDMVAAKCVRFEVDDARNARGYTGLRPQTLILYHRRDLILYRTLATLLPMVLCG